MEIAAEVQDRLAAAFAERYGDGVTPHVLALTLTALSLTDRVWFAAGNAGIVPAAEQVMAEFLVVVRGWRSVCK